MPLIKNKNKELQFVYKIESMEEIPSRKRLIQTELCYKKLLAIMTSVYSVIWNQAIVSMLSGLVISSFFWGSGSIISMVSPLITKIGRFLFFVWIEKYNLTGNQQFE